MSADRAVGTNRDRTKDLYFGGCHKVWYPSARTEGTGRNKKTIKQSIEHSDYQHNGKIAGGMEAKNLLTYNSGGHCGAPLKASTGQSHPMGIAALALSSGSY